MDIEIAEHVRMSESGSSLLRLIQNQDMPLLDLFIRESVQNALDAAKKGAFTVDVDLLVGTFEAAKINNLLKGISYNLNRRFGNETEYKYIAIRDSNTTGLTGPVSYANVQNNNFGNLLKLVYEICKPQQQEGSGGSWGLGKTVYFRIGIGLVFYYSRIYLDGKYQSRMAACLVEDETKSNALIVQESGVKRGIAWWGKKTGVNRTEPITDEKEITEILHLFNIEEYSSEETGTTIIVPYINDELLLNEVYATNETSREKPYWTKSTEEYLSVAIQRWYAPRISNMQYKLGPYLQAKVNGKQITVSKMLPLFRLIRELYSYGVDETVQEDSFLDQVELLPTVAPINLKSVFSGKKGYSAGNFIYIKLDKNQLMMDYPDNNKSPYQQINNHFMEMESNTPIIMYTRKPGMIVGYDFNSIWTNGMASSADDEYIIGLFVAHSENEIKKFREPIKLEEYIRKGEKADHTSWTDRNIDGISVRIIANIQNGIKRRINNDYKEQELDIGERKNIGLGLALADILLPTSSFGKAASENANGYSSNNNSGSEGSGEGKNRRGKAALKITSAPKYAKNIIEVDFVLNMGTKKDNTSLMLLINSESKNFNADEWESEEEIGNKYPIYLSKIWLKSFLRQAREEYEILEDCYIDGKEIHNFPSDIKVEKMVSITYQSWYGVKFTVSSMTGYCLKGTVQFSYTDNKVQSIIDIK